MASVHSIAKSETRLSGRACIPESQGTSPLWICTDYTQMWNQKNNKNKGKVTEKKNKIAVTEVKGEGEKS